MTNEQLTPFETLAVHSAILGTIAFKNGKKCAPVLDRDLMNAIESMEDRSFSKMTVLFRAWSESWHAANLAPTAV
jgi:hypothetical protein